MKRKTKILTAVLASLLLTASAVVGVSAAKTSANSPTVTVEGREVEFPDQKPIIKNNRTLVPIRFVAESLGYDVDWNPADHTAVIDNGRIILYIGSNQAVINGRQVELDVASELIADRTMVPLRVIAETLGCTVDWFGTNSTVLINPRAEDGSEMSVFERFEQSGLFWHYETSTSEYLVWRENYATPAEAAEPENFDAWWIERVKDKSVLDNQSLDCTLVMRTFHPEELAQVKDMFYTVYPTKVEEAYDILMKTVRGELWQTFYREDSEWYPLYAAMPATSGTFGMTYLDDRQVEMYCNNTCTRLTIQISEEGYENPEEPRRLSQDEIDFYTEQAKRNYCLELWGLE